MVNVRWEKWKTEKLNCFGIMSGEKLKNWKTEKLNYFRKCQVSLPSNISQNNSVFQFFSFSVSTFDISQNNSVFQFFSFQFFSCSVYITYMHIYVCIKIYIYVYRYIYLFIWINVYTYMYMVHPLTSVIIPKSIHQSMKKGRLLGGVVPYIYIYICMYHMYMLGCVGHRLR